MRVRLTSLAETDLGDIASYLTASDPQAAQRVETAFQEALAILGTDPEVGHATRGDLRRYVIPRYPYVIYYRIVAADHALDVLTIRHAARRPIV